MTGRCPHDWIRGEAVRECRDCGAVERLVVGRQEYADNWHWVEVRKGTPLCDHGRYVRGLFERIVGGAR